MTNSNDSNSSIRMVLVAEKSDRRLTRLQAALDGVSVAPILCRDIYAALREIVGSAGHWLVAGELSELCRQNGRFIEICAMRGIPCIGWLPSRPSGQVIRGLDAAVRAGLEIVGDSETLQRAVERYLHQLRTPALTASGERTGIRREEALLTEQELAALFGDT
ncbi:MAG: hypothetical protein GX455_10065 [Phycisphaerae bacterium]|nr:hypothetical protein [Phycisphaerae bacterium]